MIDCERVAKSGCLKPVQPTAGKNFRVKHLPKSVHPPLKPDNRPPWNDEVLIGPGGNRFQKSVCCRIIEKEVPCPDYICCKATLCKCEGATAMPQRDVVLIKKNYKPAFWCDPVRHVKKVKHCTEYCNGKVQETEVDLPNNYQHLYIDDKALRDMERRDGGHKAYIYVPWKDAQQESPTNTKVFYENRKAKFVDQDQDKHNVLRLQSCKRLDQYAYLPN